MTQGISLIIKIIRDVWNNFKNAPNINQERYDLKGVAEVSSDEVQNKCKRDCACEKKKEYRNLKRKDAK